MTTSVSSEERLKYLLKEYLVLIGIVLLAVITAIIEPKFFSTDNLTNIMRQFGALAFVALGMTFVIISGYIDLSVAGILSLSGAVSLIWANKFGAAAGLAMAIIVGGGCGLFNGLFLLLVGADKQSKALFITYGTSTMFSALALMYTGAATPHLNPGMKIMEIIGSGKIGFISVSFLMLIIVLLILHFFHKNTYMGSVISYTGGNHVAAQLTGMPVKRAMVLVYTICGILTSIASVVLYTRVTSSSPTVGRGYDTNAILSVVVGGTALAGGKGGVLRTLIGCTVVTLMSNCLNLLGVSIYAQTVLKGAILVIAIWLDNRKDM